MNFTINQIVEHSLVAFILKSFVSSNENETRDFFRYIKRRGKGGVVICDLAYTKLCSGSRSLDLQLPFQQTFFSNKGPVTCDGL
jgi:hypothetical protein